MSAKVSLGLLKILHMFGVGLITEIAWATSFSHIKRSATQAFLMMWMKNSLLAISRDLHCAHFLEINMGQACHEETDHHKFLQGGVLLEEKLTPVEVILGLESFSFSWNRQSKSMDSLFRAYLLLCAGFNHILHGTP